ncbi:MAG: hypothetical protein AB1668_02600 [Nanoarchaeota archaeon]
MVKEATSKMDVKEVAFWLVLIISNHFNSLNNNRLSEEHLNENRRDYLLGIIRV